MSRSFIIEKENNGARIDRFLADAAPELSRSRIQKLIKDAHITVNEKPVKSNYRLLTDDVISLSIPELKEPDILPEALPLDILYEDRDVIVVNKPKGMVVHPAPGHYTGTLVNALLYHCKDQLSGINGDLRPGIVHRIDMDTTGSLIVCKNDLAHQNLSEQLKEHSIHRIYIAIVHGNIKEDEGTVNAPIGRHPTERKKMSIHSRNGREAITHYQVLERFGRLDVLVNNAGFGKCGDFFTSNRASQMGMVDVNCRSLTRMTLLCLPFLRAGSRIVNLASASAFCPQPYFSVYAATKSYVLSFSRSLGEELRKKGIVVTAVCPGPVDTEFFKFSGKPQNILKELTMAKADRVVHQALKDCRSGKSVSVYGIPMKLTYFGTKLLPHGLLVHMQNL